MATTDTQVFEIANVMVHLNNYYTIRVLQIYVDQPKFEQWRNRKCLLRPLNTHLPNPPFHQFINPCYTTGSTSVLNELFH